MTGEECQKSRDGSMSVKNTMRGTIRRGGERCRVPSIVPFCQNKAAKAQAHFCTPFLSFVENLVEIDAGIRPPTQMETQRGIRPHTHTWRHREANRQNTRLQPLTDFWQCPISADLPAPNTWPGSNFLNHDKTSQVLSTHVASFAPRQSSAHKQGS